MDAKPRCPECSRIGKVYQRANPKRFPKEWRCRDCGLEWSTRTDYKQAYQRGIEYNRGKGYAAALKEISYALSLHPDPDWPDYPAAFFNRGISKSDIGLLEQAIADYDQAIILQPDYPSAFFNRGISKHELHLYRQAVEDYRTAIELDPDEESFYSEELDKSLQALKTAG